MAQKENAVWVAEKGAYQIQFKDGKGNLKIRDTVPMVAHMEPYKAITVMQGFASAQTSQREAAMSLLAEVLDFGGDAMLAYKGKCEPEKNLPNEMTSSFRSSEEGYFRQFMQKDHDHHDAFVKALPKINERAERLEVGGTLNAERQFQYFLTTMRKAPSYTNAKNIVLGFWGYCGQSPVGADDQLVPPEIMRVMVANVRTIEPRDTSLKGRLWELHRELIAEGKNPPDQDMAEVLGILKEMYEHAQVLAKAAEGRLRAAVKPGDRVDVKEAADKAMTSAQNTLKSTETQPA